MRKSIHVAASVLVLSCARPTPAPETRDVQVEAQDAPAEAQDAPADEPGDVRVPVLSTFETRFDPIDGRTKNISLAAAKIDGSIIESEKVFSFNETVGIRSAENGYVNAPVLLQGRRTDDLGGGVCQVSSTLHAAAILGGLEVKERRPHSLVPKYIEPGFDATVAFPASCAVKDAPCGKLDLKLRNPFPTPLTIRARVEDGDADVPKKRMVVWLEGAKPHFKVTITKQTEPMGRGGRRWVRSGKVLDPAHVKVVQQAGDGYFVRSTAVYEHDGQPVRAPFKWFSRYPPVDEVWEVGWKRPADAGDPW